MTNRRISLIDPEKITPEELIEVQLLDNEQYIIILVIYFNNEKAIKF